MDVKYVVFGAGMMGSAAAYDLATTRPADSVVLADIDAGRAAAAAKAIGPNVTPVRLDVQAASDAELAALFEGAAAALSAVSYTVNLRLTQAAVAAGVHLCDLGGNNDVVRRQRALDGEAKRRGVTIIPNTGLAPGLINILAMTAAGRFDVLETIRLRVGGLPQHPRPPLKYQLVFSAEGLLNEYLEKAVVIRDGRVTEVDSMTELEEIRFPEPFGLLEAFTTSGGLSTLAEVLAGRVRHLDYKTIRYPGHCEKFRTLLELGFASSEPLAAGGTLRTNREFFTDLLRKKLDYGDTDVVLARATITGRAGGGPATLVYEMIDVYDEGTKMTAMMRTTAFPAAVTAQMLADGTIRTRGVLPPELCVPGDAMIAALARRNVRITTQFTESRG